MIRLLGSLIAGIVAMITGLIVTDGSGSDYWIIIGSGFLILSIGYYAGAWEKKSGYKNR